MFQLKTMTGVLLTHINVRTERHGNDDVDAYDLDFVLHGQNSAILSLLDKRLCASLYYCHEVREDQPELPDVEVIMPDLLFPLMGEKHAWPDSMTGVDLVVDYGLGDELSNIKFEDGKAMTRHFEAKEGGTVLLHMRYQTSSMPDGALDKLRKKLKQTIAITLVQPERLRQEAVIDGTVGHPGAAEQMTPEQALADSLAG